MTTEITEAPRRRGRKPAAAIKETPVEQVVETPKNVVVEEAAQPVAPVTGPRERYIPIGGIIDVQTDRNGIALETVYQEIPLMNTSQTSHIMIAIEGSFYQR